MNWNAIWLALVAEQDQLKSLARTALTLGCGFAMGHGYVSSDTATFITGMLTLVVPVVWSVMAHTQQAQIATVAAMSAKDVNIALAALPAQTKISIAAALPEVEGISTTKALAEAIPSPKVTNGFVAPVAPARP